jgi:hypothetical protein
VSSDRWRTTSGKSWTYLHKVPGSKMTYCPKLVRHSPMIDKSKKQSQEISKRIPHCVIKSLCHGFPWISNRCTIHLTDYRYTKAHERSGKCQIGTMDLCIGHAMLPQNSCHRRLLFQETDSPKNASGEPPSQLSIDLSFVKLLLQWMCLI